MNAVEFVKKFGWGEAMTILRDALPEQTHTQVEGVGVYKKYKYEDGIWYYWFSYFGVSKWCESEGYIYMVKSGHEATCLKNMVNIADLKQIVDAWELVEAWGGIDRTKDRIEWAIVNKNYYAADMMKHSINLVEQCNA